MRIAVAQFHNIVPAEKNIMWKTFALPLFKYSNLCNTFVYICILYNFIEKMV